MRKLALAFLPTLALLLVLEGLARMLHPTVPLVLHPSQSNCQQRSALLGQEFRPHCVADTMGKRFETNELGLRDRALDDDRAPRILAMGDSCTFGWSVEQDEAYPQVLQAMVDREAGAHRYRVVNAGVPGYTSYHGLLYLRDRGLALQPAVVVAGYGFNDIFR